MKFTDEEARGIVDAWSNNQDRKKRNNVQNSIASWAGTVLAVTLVAFIVVVLIWGIVAIGAVMRDLLAVV